MFCMECGIPVARNGNYCAAHAAVAVSAQGARSTGANGGQSAQKRARRPLFLAAAVGMAIVLTLSAILAYEVIVPRRALDRARQFAKQNEFEKAIQIWQPLANSGLASAEFNLGLVYLNGEGVTKDPNQAIAWFRKAADQGLADAQVMVGRMYDDGEAVVKDANQAVGWYRKAAAQDSASAELQLGASYVTGQGVAKDLNQAFRWYMKAANHGEPSAEDTLGLMYYQGVAVPKDLAQAKIWWAKAADHGNAQARAALQQLQADELHSPAPTGLNAEQSAAVMTVDHETITRFLADIYSQVSMHQRFDDLGENAQTDLLWNLARVRLAAAKAISEGLGHEVVSADSTAQIRGWIALYFAYIGKHPMQPIADSYWRFLYDQNALDLQHRGVPFEQAKAQIADDHLQALLDSPLDSREKTKILPFAHKLTSDEKTVLKIFRDNPRLASIYDLNWRPMVSNSRQAQICDNMKRSMIFYAKQQPPPADEVWRRILDQYLQVAVQAECF